MMIFLPRQWLSRLSNLKSCCIAVLICLLQGTLTAHAQFENLGFLTEASSDVAVRNASIAFDTENSKIRWQKSGSAPISAEIDQTQIFADVIEYDVNRELLLARGGVAIYKGGMIYRGESIRYDLRSEEISANALRTAKEPIYLDAGDFESATEDIGLLTTSDSYFTTHDSVHPNFRIKAKRVDVYPEDRIVFHDLTAYAGNIPVFYLPYLSQPMDEELGYTFAPGYSSNWGVYLLNQYGTLIGDHSIAKIHVDLRSERGIAGGLELISRRHREKENYGQFQFYVVNDSSPETNSVGRSSTRVGDQIPDSGRYRLNLQHRVYLPGPEESSFYVDIDLNKVSDEFFYEDFFPNEFRIDPRPDNLVNIVKSSPGATLSLLGRFQVNDFFKTDTRLPELALDFTRQPIFDSGLFYEGTTSFGIYAEELASTDHEKSLDRITVLKDRLKRFRSDQAAFIGLNPNFDAESTRDELDSLRAKIADSGFTRFHSYHELLYPKTIGGWLNLTPRVGVGVTAYSNVQGRGNIGDESRFIAHAGLDASFKVAKTYPDVKLPVLGLDGARHVIQPYVNYSYLESDSLSRQFPRVDRLVPSTRLRPLDVSQFTAIDDLASWNTTRTGIWNRLITRRDGRNFDWAGLNTYVDFFIEDPEFDRSHSNLFNELYWRPLPWLRLNIDSQLPIGGGEEYTELISRLTFQPTDWWEFSIGHLHLQDHPFFEDSSQLTFSTYARLSENWGIGMIQRYEMDDNTLEVQQYSIHRDMASWTASFGALIRDNRGEEEYGIIFALTLKEFPRVSIPLQLDPSGNQ